MGRRPRSGPGVGPAWGGWGEHEVHLLWPTWLATWQDGSRAAHKLPLRPHPVRNPDHTEQLVREEEKGYMPASVISLCVGVAVGMGPPEGSERWGSESSGKCHLPKLRAEMAVRPVAAWAGGRRSPGDPLPLLLEAARRASPCCLQDPEVFHRFSLPEPWLCLLTSAVRPWPWPWSQPCPLPSGPRSWH